MRFMTLLAVPAVVLGLVLWLHYGIGKSGPGNGWMHAKLLIVLLLLGYHHACGRILKRFERGDNQRSHVWFRWFNEAPVLMMVVAVVLVVVKPFNTMTAAGGAAPVFTPERHRSIAWSLALGWACLVCYASLYPFVGWRYQGGWCRGPT